MVLSTFWDVIWASMILFFIWIPLIMMWFFALTDLFRRPDMRWGKVLWLMVIIFIPFFGALIYILVRPNEELAAIEQERMMKSGG